MISIIRENKVVFLWKKQALVILLELWEFPGLQVMKMNFVH
jgi:hypothetical protein